MAILTVDQFREHVTTALGDDAIKRLLDAAEADIVRYAGDGGAVTDYVDGQGRFATTHKPIGTIASVSEIYGDTTLVLAVNDYLVRSACVLERLTTGDHSRHCWRGRVAIAYTPQDDADIRVGVQLDLVNLALAFQPGVTLETVGAWTQQYTQAVASNKTEHDAILSRLDVGPELAVVG